MTAALFALLAPLALAGAEDVVLDLKVTEPMGTTLVDEQVSVPYKQTETLTLGEQDYTVVIEADLEMYGPMADATVEVVVAVYRLDGEARMPTRLTSPTLVLPMDSSQRARATIKAPEPVYGPDGQPLMELTWDVQASWTERRDPTWLTEARARPASPGEAVLAWADATLYAEPGVAVGRLRALDERALTQGAVLAWEVVEDQGEWLRVVSMPSRKSRKHCFPGDPVLYGLNLDVYLRREDLLLTTHTSAVMDYSDGTGTSLAAGVPLLPVLGATMFGYPLFEGMAHGLRFRIPLPPAPLALGYVPLGGSLEKPRDHRLDISPDGLLGETGAGPLRSLTGAEARSVTVFSTEGERTGVMVGDHCAEHRVQVPAAALHLPEATAADELVLGGQAGGAYTPGFVIPFGVPLSWADGRTAGIATREVELTLTPVSVGERVCVDLAAEGASQRQSAAGGAGLQLCVDARDLPR